MNLRKLLRPTIPAGLFRLSVLLLAGVLPAAAPAQSGDTAPGQVEVLLDESKVDLKVRRVQQPDYKPARAGEQTDFDSLPEDFWVNAGLKDIRLQNDLALVMFGTRFSTEEVTDAEDIELREGNPVDIAVGPDAPENFNCFAPNVADSVRAFLVVDSVAHSTEADGSAVVVTDAHDIRHPFLKSRTEYRMFKDMPGLLATTTLTNTSAAETAPAIASADHVMWGHMTPFVPGVGWTRGASAVKSAEFVFGRRYDSWVMIAPETGTFDVSYQGELTRLLYAPPADMEPGETRLYRRWILVSQLDSAYLYSKVLERRGDQEYGTLVGRMIERDQAPDGTMIEKSPVVGAEVFITPMNRAGWGPEDRARLVSKPYLIARTLRSGAFNANLPVGEYRTIPAPRTRMAPAPNHTTQIKKGEIAALDFGTSPASRLVYTIIDEATKQLAPGKLTVEPLRGTAEPELGWPGMVRAANVVFSSHGAGSVELPPGSYRVIASRGPEYHTTEARIDVKELRDTNQVFVLKRAFDTPGWIAADVGVRTDATENVRVDGPTRITSAVAEGLEWLVTGDANVATDLSGDLATLGLERFIKVSPGYRHSGGSEPFRGDFLLFPTDVCATGATPDFSPIRRAGSTAEILSAMRGVCPEAAILSARATFPVAGYFSLNGWRGGTRIPDGDWSRDFDAFSVWEGKRQGIFDRDYKLYHNLLASGARLAAFGGSFSTGTWMREPGYPRVYIKSSVEDPQRLDPAELAQSIKDRLVCVTNGPFVNVRANGEEMGSLVTDSDGEVDLDIEVLAANWSQVASISVNVNGLFVRRILVNPALVDPSAGRVFPAADKPQDGRLRIKVTADSVLDVSIEGTKDLTQDPVNPFFTTNQTLKISSGQFPLALSAPIFIDADGDGRVTLKPPPDQEPTPDDRHDPPY